MIKKLYSKNWDYEIYLVDGELVASIVFFGRVDYSRSFRIERDQLSDNYELLDDLSEKIRNNYDRYKTLEIVPAIRNTRSRNKSVTTFQARASFYLKSADSYFYTENYRITGDIRQDIKTLLSIYSAGLELSAVDAYLLEIIKHSYPIHSWKLSVISDYYLAISLLSCIKVRFPSTTAAVLGELIPYDSDRLMKFIAMDGTELDYNITMLHPNPYIFLHNFIVSKGAEVGSVTGFLSNYYAALKDTSWHDSHLNDEKSYFGYWSVSLAAVVLKMNVDDHLFLDHMFYPRDLIHRQFLPTWEDSERGVLARAKKTELLEKDKQPKEVFSNEELKQLIVSEYEEILSAKQKDIFTASFKEQVKEIQRAQGESTKMDSAKMIKSFVRDFAQQISQKTDENHPFHQFLHDEDVKSAIAEIISGTHKIEGIDLEVELANFFDQDIDEKIQAEQIQQFQQLGVDILVIDEKYTEEDEAYWDELEELFEPFQTPKTDPMVALKESIADTISTRLKPKGKAINFKFSIDDFL